MKRLLKLTSLLGLICILIACGTDNNEVAAAVRVESQQSSQSQREDTKQNQTKDTIDQSSEEDEGMVENLLYEDEIRVIVGDNSFVIKLEDNESANALRDFLLDGDKTISASNYGGFEKVCQLGVNLPSSDKQTTTQAGDVMLYNRNQIVIFYGSNSWAYTKLGKVENLSAEELENILSGSETEITLSLN